MGMYDYLNGEQVKCFSIPIVYIDRDFMRDDEEERVCMSSMGGLLRGFNKGDKVPYRTNIYNYGKDFIVFDYRGFEEEYIVHFIKDGKVSEYYHAEKLPPVIPVMLVVDNYGNPLNIKSRNDFFEIIEDHKNYIEKQYFTGCREIRGLFDDYIESVRNNTPREDLKKEYDKLSEDLRERTMAVFRKKWFADDRKVVSNNIGWLVDILLNEPKGEEETNRLLERYKQENKDFMKDVERYKEWVEGYYTSDEIDRVLKIIVKRGKL